MLQPATGRRAGPPQLSTDLSSIVSFDKPHRLPELLDCGAADCGLGGVAGVDDGLLGCCGVDGAGALVSGSGSNGFIGFSPSCLAICFSGVLSGCNVRRYMTKAQAWSGVMLSENEGIGEPSSPVMKSLYIA